VARGIRERRISAAVRQPVLCDYADSVPPDSSTDGILQGLNAPQREAVLHERGPLMILAGAGSGKTRTVTHRMAHLIRQGSPPESLLAITFTNKAAGEMQERMERLTGVRSPWVSTFHSFCARLLRRHIHLLPPYSQSFTIYDPEDLRSVLREILDELDVDKALWTPRSAQAEISRIKNSAEISADAARSVLTQGQVLRNILRRYGEVMQERNAVDFDDLLLLTVRLFEEQAKVLERYQDQFQHVLIDEYQDTNAVQYRIGLLLAASRRNICITGDPDQSIYRWRGADVTNILNFERDYPDARVVLLEQNYRSTKSVLTVANALIAHNRLRKEKSLWTENVHGEAVRVYRFTGDTEEAEEVASLIRHMAEDGVPLGSIAVFYRVNSLSRPVEQSLIYAGIPYSIVGGIAYFLRREVKDVLAYVRILDNPRDAESLKRIINVPPRGVGKSTLERLAQKAKDDGTSLLEVVLGGAPVSRVGKKSVEALRGFAELYRDLASRRAQLSISDLIAHVIRATGYEEYLREAEGEAAREHVDNVWELVNAATEYERSTPEPTLTGFLELVNLLGDVDRWRPKEDRITLMTLHAAKGLEFPVVMIVGVEDGILPLLNAEDLDPDIEEERRLLYVGITRARERLYLTHAASRMRFGRVRASYPSRFLGEIQRGVRKSVASEESLEVDGETEDSIAFLDASASGTSSNRARGGSRRAEDGDDNEPAWEDAAYGGNADDEPLAVGARVRHAEYGEGSVVRLSGVGQRMRVTVAFDDGEEKQFVLAMAPLHRIR